MLEDLLYRNLFSNNCDIAQISHEDPITPKRFWGEGQKNSFLKTNRGGAFWPQKILIVWKNVL